MSNLKLFIYQGNTNCNNTLILQLKINLIYKNTLHLNDFIKLRLCHNHPLVVLMPKKTFAIFKVNLRNIIILEHF